MIASSSTAGEASSKKQCRCKACRQRPLLTHISTRRPSTFRCRTGRTRHLMMPTETNEFSSFNYWRSPPAMLVDDVDIAADSPRADSSTDSPCESPEGE